MSSDAGIIRGQPEQEDLVVNATSCYTAHALFRPSAGYSIETPWLEKCNLIMLSCYLVTWTDTPIWMGNVSYNMLLIKDKHLWPRETVYAWKCRYFYILDRRSLCVAITACPSGETSPAKGSHLVCDSGYCPHQWTSSWPGWCPHEWTSSWHHGFVCEARQLWTDTKWNSHIHLTTGLMAVWF